MEESNDSIDMIENRNDADDDELSPMNFALNRLGETTSAVEGKIDATPLSHMNPSNKRMTTATGMEMDWASVATKGEKSRSKQSAPKYANRCTVCGYVSFNMGNVKRHIRTHTGEKPYRCDRCARRFASAEILLKHAATHIEDFPFHCRACFRGFSLKAEAVAHEKHCQQRHFECYLCKKLVTCVKYELTRHMRKHTGDKPFRCEICMKHFCQKEVLKRHLNTIHA